MSVSTNAVLFWGIANPDWYNQPWTYHTDYEENSENEVDDWEDRLKKKLGDNFASYKEWFTKRDKYGCKVDVHCSDRCMMYYVCVTASEVTAYRGDIERLSDNQLEVDPEWYPKLQRFCEFMDIPWEEPGWILVSYWG